MQMMRGALILAPVLLVCLTSCSGVRSGPRAALSRFPIGIYDVTKPEHLERLKKYGFDSFETSSRGLPEAAVLAKEAVRQDMRMLVSPDSLIKGDVAITEGWPIDAWYLRDEPDVVQISVLEFSSAANEVRGWDPIRPQLVVIGQGAAAEKYGLVGDILMVDWYPVPHLALDSVADQMDTAARSLPVGKPLWFVVQAFDWRDYRQRNPDKPRIGRFPDYAEIRFMSYLAVMHGARGLFYYTLNKPGGKTLFDFPEEFQAVTRVVGEIKVLQPIFEAGRLAPLPFVPEPDGVEARAWRHRGRDYVLILNRNAHEVQRVPDSLLTNSWRPLFEVRRDPRDALVKREDRYFLPPYRVMVFESRLKFFGR